jgi:hypothetical protein
MGGLLKAGIGRGLQNVGAQWMSIAQEEQKRKWMMEYDALKRDQALADKASDREYAEGQKAADLKLTKGLWEPYTDEQGRSGQRNTHTGEIKYMPSGGKPYLPANIEAELKAVNGIISSLGGAEFRTPEDDERLQWAYQRQAQLMGWDSSGGGGGGGGSLEDELRSAGLLQDDKPEAEAPKTTSNKAPAPEPKTAEEYAAMKIEEQSKIQNPNTWTEAHIKKMYQFYLDEWNKTPDPLARERSINASTRYSGR